MKKKMIALSLGFMFLIAGFSFNLVSFEVESNEVKAEKALNKWVDKAHNDNSRLDCTLDGYSCGYYDGN